jgi:flagellar motility protein MotE (MotC chaperone)
LDYHTLEGLRRNHPAWRLLAADHAPLILSFLHKTYLQPNIRVLAQSELGMRLEDFLYHLRDQLGDSAFPRSAGDYLNDWASDEHGWLRKFYPEGNDEAHFDLTPATEKAIEWLAQLEQQHFIGTESRLLTIFELLNQIVQGTETDPEARIAELEKRRADIDAEIERIRQGEFTLMEPTQLKERFYQVEQTARTLLADFRQVEQNFRGLDRAVRERVTTWDGSRGELLESVFGERDAIADSDQGKSFHAFWDFVMSPQRQEELSLLLERTLALEAIAALQPDTRLLRIHYDWLEAGEATQRTVARLSEQLRKYLDDQAWLENRRIMTLIQGIERQAVELRERAPAGSFTAIDDSSPEIELIMDRPLFTPPLKPHISQQILEEGGDAVDADALFEQVYVDKTRLAARVRQALQSRDQIALTAVLETHPLEQGLAELVAYLSLAAADAKAVIDDERSATINWTDGDGVQRRATLPTVVFCR